MPTIDTLRNDIVNEFYDNSIMLNVAMNIEYFLCDEALLYPYKNWSKGEIVSGPHIKKYDVCVILRYDYNEMPDPEGGLVLKRFGVRTIYRKINISVIDEEKTKENNKTTYKKEPSWFVILYIPKELVSDENQRKELDIIDDLLDLETLETASDDNIEEDGSFDDFGGMSNMGRNSIEDLDIEVDSEQAGGV